MISSNVQPAFIQATETARFWEGNEGRSISPDTGQQCGSALGSNPWLNLIAHATGEVGAGQLCVETFFK